MRLVLVHGSAHGAWCWDLLIPALRLRGHDPVAIDLPGRDGTGHAALTLADLGEAVAAAAAGDVVITHSAGGAAAEMAATRPGAVRGIIHICAYVPRRGDSIVSLRRAQAEQPLRGLLQMSADRASYAFDPKGARRVLYHDVPPNVADAAIARLVPEAVAPQAQGLPVDPADLPRHYIRCTDDRTIPPAFQARMVADWPRDSVTDLPAGHAPFLSMPERLADVITGALARMI